MEIVFLIVGLVLGFFIAYLIFKNKKPISNSGDELANLLTELEQTKTKYSVEAEKNNQLAVQITDLKEELQQERSAIISLNASLAESKTDFKNIKEKLDTQKEEIETLQKQSVEHFNNVANKILEEKTQKFTQQNKENIDQVLKPLNEKLKDFEKKVEETYEKNLKDKTSLQVEVKKLYELNAKISEEANNLTKALKGDVKKQGNWGEMVLERILESSGLEKGREYKTQESFNREDGGRYQPDVVIYLPENKHVVVDAKVSLVAYENYVSADIKEDQDAFMKEHLRSIRAHIKELSDKQYFKLEGLNAPEYVLMFIPIEASFSITVKEDNAIFNEAWSNKIVIVSPSTLIATLMTISSIWNQENQTRNAIEIARQSGNLYDKFEGLLKDLIQIGKKIEDTQTYYKNSMNKLTEGKGNLISRVENLRTLGAKASKQIPQQLIERAVENDELE